MKPDAVSRENGSCANVSEQHKDYTERYDILGKKINKYLQQVMKSHLSPKDKKSHDFKVSENLEPYMATDK